MSELIFPLHIRPGNLVDIGAMALTWERAQFDPDEGDGPLPTRPHWRYQVLVERHFSNPDTWSLVVPVENKLAAFAMGAPLTGVERSEQQQTDHLAELMVDPDYWGRGLGTTLIGLAAENAVKRGRRHISLWVGESNERAKRLYKHLAFVPTGEMDGLELLSRYAADLPLRTPSN